MYTEQQWLHVLDKHNMYSVHVSVQIELCSDEMHNMDVCMLVCARILYMCVHVRTQCTGLWGKYNIVSHCVRFVVCLYYSKL